MKKVYGNLSIDDLYSFLIDCIGLKFTNEWWLKNKTILKNNSKTRNYENSRELFFSETGILKTFFTGLNNTDNNENQIKKVEKAITNHFFIYFYDASLNLLKYNFPDNNDMSEQYFYGAYESLVKINNEFDFDIWLCF